MAVYLTVIGGINSCDIIDNTLLSSNTKQVSTATGWNYNDPKFGGFEVKQAREQETGPGLIFVEGGAFIMGRAAEDLQFDWNNAPRRVTVDSYYIDEVEVSNVVYRSYIHWVKTVYSDYPDVHKNALPDTLAWRKPLGYNEPLVSIYFRHPAYDDYPVVGVSWRQASEFCLWRTDRVNELMLIRHGVLNPDPTQKGANSFNTAAYLTGQYEGAVNRNLRDFMSEDKNATRRVTFDDGILLPNYRLPTEAEWEYAAIAPVGVTYDERVVERRIYPWSGNSLRNSDKKYRGAFMANFQRGRGDLMGVAGSQNDGYAIPAPVRSFWPNDFGLYCMAGNVNEWVADVYRPLSSEDVDEFSPFRGNVFTDIAKDAEGNVLPKDSLGRIRIDTVGYDGNRNNYQLGDNRNYRDGDILSSISYEENSSVKPETRSNSNRMYDQGSGTDQTGMTSLVSDYARVYKGGSFLDRAYWLSPGTRRFLDERKSAIDIGFRCAMDKVGTPRRQYTTKTTK
ncbi:MAG: SUMF1/EgtB/PvdO family nonheme iron enzyme [Prevotellaceae bacterium]|nr:SUMF1/EgtB/PvdO family nonheme iron enzyme [Prevotellaceae bacterium]